MKGAHVVVDGESRVLGTSHLPILVALPQSVCAWGVTEFRSLSQQFCCVFVIHKDSIVESLFVKESQLVEGMREFGGRVFCRSLQPFDSFPRSLG